MTGDDLKLSGYLLGQVVFYSLPLWLHAAYDALKVSRWGNWTQSARRRTAIEEAAAGLFCLGAIGFRAPDPSQFIYFQF